MLLTQQRFEPFIYTPPAGTFFDDFKLVVYGHADVGKLNSAKQWIGTVKHVENSVAEQWYASDWHLARRVVGFVKSTPNGTGTATWPPTSPFVLGTASGDAITDAIYDLSPPSVFLADIRPGLYAYKHEGTGTTQLDQFYLEHSDDEKYLSRDGDRYLLYGSPDRYWWRWIAPYQWRRKNYADGDIDLNPGPDLPPDEVDGYSAYVSSGDHRKYRFWPAWFCNPGSAGPGSNIHRTQLDPMPPPGMPGRTAAYFMPSCSEFKVEYTYDDPREIVVDPATGRPDLVDLNDDGTLDAPAASPVNWQTVPPGEIYVWTGLSTDPSVYDTTDPAGLRNRTFPFRWPRALRITIRAYAPGGALDYPIEHSLVHVWK